SRNQNLFLIRDLDICRNSGYHGRIPTQNRNGKTHSLNDGMKLFQQLIIGCRKFKCLSKKQLLRTRQSFFRSIDCFFKNDSFMCQMLVDQTNAGAGLGKDKSIMKLPKSFITTYFLALCLRLKGDGIIVSRK